MLQDEHNGISDLNWRTDGVRPYREQLTYYAAIAIMTDLVVTMSLDLVQIPIYSLLILMMSSRAAQGQIGPLQWMLVLIPLEISQRAALLIMIISFGSWGVSELGSQSLPSVSVYGIAILQFFLVTWAMTLFTKSNQRRNTHPEAVKFPRFPWLVRGLIIFVVFSMLVMPVMLKDLMRNNLNSPIYHQLADARAGTYAGNDDSVGLPGHEKKPPLSCSFQPRLVTFRSTIPSLME